MTRSRITDRALFGAHAHRVHCFRALVVSKLYLTAFGNLFCRFTRCRTIGSGVSSRGFRHILSGPSPDSSERGGPLSRIPMSSRNVAYRRGSWELFDGVKALTDWLKRHWTRWNSDCGGNRHGVATGEAYTHGGGSGAEEGPKKPRFN